MRERGRVAAARAGQAGVGAALAARVEIFDQSALRHYYAARNCILVARDYWRRYPALLLINLITLKHIAFVLLHAREKRMKLQAILCGIADGLRGKYGRV